MRGSRSLAIAGTVVDDGRIVWMPGREPGPAADRLAALRRAVFRRLAWAEREVPGAELTTTQLGDYVNDGGGDDIERALAGPCAAGDVRRREAREAISRTDTRPITRVYWRLAKGACDGDGAMAATGADAMGTAAGAAGPAPQ